MVGLNVFVHELSSVIKNSGSLHLSSLLFSVFFSLCAYCHMVSRRLPQLQVSHPYTKCYKQKGKGGAKVL